MQLLLVLQDISKIQKSPVVAGRRSRNVHPFGCGPIQCARFAPQSEPLYTITQRRGLHITADRCAAGGGDQIQCSVFVVLFFLIPPSFLILLLLDSILLFRIDYFLLIVHKPDFVSQIYIPPFIKTIAVFLRHRSSPSRAIRN